MPPLYLTVGELRPSLKFRNSWQGSAPISCTLPHSKALAHWRQVRRNYLFQGGYPWYHLICTPPRRGSPSWFPQSPGLWDMDLTPGGRSGTFIPGWLPLVPPDLYSPQEGPLPGPLLPSLPSLPPKFYPQPMCYFQNIVLLMASQTRPRKRIINDTLYNPKTKL